MPGSFITAPPPGVETNTRHSILGSSSHPGREAGLFNDAYTLYAPANSKQKEAKNENLFHGIINKIDYKLNYT